MMGQLNRFLKPRKGNTTVMTIGFTLVSLMLGVVSVDIPLYFVYQNQLQSAVNAAALAGASQLPLGQAYAEEEAIKVAGMNPVGDHTLQAEDLSFTYVNGSTMTMQVQGQTQAPTLFANLVCGMKENFETPEEEQAAQQAQQAGVVSGDCSLFTLKAKAKAIPTARDTMIVIDNSSSMTFLGNNRPLKDVRNGATDYVNKVLQLNAQTADRIGLVKFAYDGTLIKGLKTVSQDPGFSSLKSSINNISAYSAQGWNTNYEAGLKLALNEIKTNGRPNSQKIIVFFTDGLPNLPAPSSYYSYSTYQPYNKCIDPVHTAVSTTYKSQACTYNSSTKKWTCPSLPSTKIKDFMISNTAQSCMQTYANYMESSVKALVDDAHANDITIHTISIAEADAEQTDNAWNIIRQVMKNPTWNPALLDYMANTTSGNMYHDDSYDPTMISDMFTSIAQDVRVRLAE